MGSRLLKTALVAGLVLVTYSRLKRPTPYYLADDDRSTHSAMKLGPGTSPGRTGNSCSSYSGGQKNSCACSSTHTKPALAGSSEFTRVAGPPEGPVGGQGDCALADAPDVAIIVTRMAAIVSTIIMRRMLSATP